MSDDTHSVKFDDVPTIFKVLNQIIKISKKSHAVCFELGYCPPFKIFGLYIHIGRLLGMVLHRYE